MHTQWSIRFHAFDVHDAVYVESDEVAGFSKLSYQLPEESSAFTSEVAVADRPEPETDGAWTGNQQPPTGNEGEVSSRHQVGHQPR